MNKSSTLLLFIKRLILIVFSTIVVILILYGCSAAKAVSNYKTYSLASDIGSIYQSRDTTYVLEIASYEEAYFYVGNSVELYEVTVKENILFLTYKDEKNVFVALSRNEMLYQTKDVYLYRVVDNE